MSYRCRLTMSGRRSHCVRRRALLQQEVRHSLGRSRAPATVVGALHAVPLKIETGMPPVVAVAAQITAPAPLLVQLGSEVTDIAKVFHPAHFVPLKSFTMIAALFVRTAHATRFVEANAQDGLPTPVFAPVETGLPQLARAAGTSARQIEQSISWRRARVIWISFLLGNAEISWMVRKIHTLCKWSGSGGTTIISSPNWKLKRPFENQTRVVVAARSFTCLSGLRKERPWPLRFGKASYLSGLYLCRSGYFPPRATRISSF